MQKGKTRGSETVEHAPPKAEPPPVEATADDDDEEEDSPTFFRCLITPKLTFNLQCASRWRVVGDIPQPVLAEAFLARFPLRFDASKLVFQSATPQLPLRDAERASKSLVFRITTAHGDDERVLLQILQNLDKAYAAKAEARLEEARAELLSTSSSFQIIADEVRVSTQACNKRWEKEVRALKDQMSSNQKRLFLLEREKEGLQKAATTSEEATGKLRLTLQQQGEENSQLRQRTGALEAQLAALQELVTSMQPLQPPPLEPPTLEPPTLRKAEAATVKPAGDEAAAGPSGPPAEQAAAAAETGMAAEAGVACAEVGCQTSPKRGAGRDDGAEASDAREAVVAAEVAEASSAEEAARRAESREAMERMQQQLSAMGEWLRTGASLLAAPPTSHPAAPAPPTQEAPPPPAAAAAAGEEEPPSITRLYSQEETFHEPSSVC